VLKDKFGGDFVFVGRFHNHVENAIDFSLFEEKYPGKIFNGNLHEDMAEYLLATDVLITDASGSMFDFSLTGRPCFLFFPDFEHYRSKERGVYLEVEKLPFPISLNFNDFCASITNFDNEEYQENIKNMHSELGYVDDANSAKRAAEFILETIEKAKK
jgi:CDP-glycerol glycerophosphotransferase